MNKDSENSPSSISAILNIGGLGLFLLLNKEQRLLIFEVLGGSHNTTNQQSLFDIQH